VIPCLWLIPLGGGMRCTATDRSEGFFSYARLEARIPADHPLRGIRELVDMALVGLSPAFGRL
jgi:hypothetical protein